MPVADGSWTETVLHSFRTKSSDGYSPLGSLIFDTVGNLYGTTRNGGAADLGTVFELTPSADGTWKENVLHDFTADGQHGYYPYAGLALDKAGNLYGTTYDGELASGGIPGHGTVFKLAPQAVGNLGFEIVHKFKNDAKDGTYPYGGLTIDVAGNLYGTTYGGGNFNGGTAFELTPNVDGTWTEKILHKFKNDGKDGYSVQGGLIFDDAGNLYGSSDTVGTVFELTPTTGGGWTERILHNFKDNGLDGNAPFAGAIIDASGHLYGTTFRGGAHDAGTVFEITP